MPAKGVKSGVNSQWASRKCYWRQFLCGSTRADATLSSTDDKKLALIQETQFRCIYRTSLKLSTAYMSVSTIIYLFYCTLLWVFQNYFLKTFFDFCFQTINCCGSINFFFTSSHNPVLHITWTSDITTQGSRYIIS